VAQVVGTSHPHRFHNPLIIMTSEDPIRIDASTVHRSVHPSTEQDVSGEIIGGGQSLETADGSKGSVGTGGVEEIAEANTVIRGSLGLKNRSRLPLSSIALLLQSRKACWERS
jgi:hypothetical protein